jgi:hypothetical protein
MEKGYLTYSAVQWAKKGCDMRTPNPNRETLRTELLVLLFWFLPDAEQSHRLGS